MTDIRTQLPDCPLAYEVPDIPSTHTALVIPITGADVDWQAKLLPWTLASLINNTDIILQGVHLKVTSDEGWVHERVCDALHNFSLPEHTCIITSGRPAIPFGRAKQYGYESVCMWDVHYWAFRGMSSSGNPEVKLPLGHLLRRNWAWGVADYSLHPLNNLLLKNEWVRTAFESLSLTDPDKRESNSDGRGSCNEVARPLPSASRSLADARPSAEQVAEYLKGGSMRARWLHDANRAVYGEDYEEHQKNVAAFFFNDSDPNWHLDASLLHYRSELLTQEMFEWVLTYQHLGRDALIALWLLKTGQHAYNFKDSLMIEAAEALNGLGAGDPAFIPPPYPWLCHTQNATEHGFRYAIKQLMGAQLGITV